MNLLLPLIFAHCTFETKATLPILAFEILILIATGLFFWLFQKVKPQLWQRFLIMTVGVLLFELFTEPMWQNYRMGKFAYLYHDVSWILTLGWTSLILTVILSVDRLFPQLKPYQRFGISLGILTLVSFPLEILVVNLGIRGYSPEVLDRISGIFIFGVPIEALYYIPVFMGLVISFYRYWELVLDQEPLIPLKHRKWLQSFGLCFLAVFLFEVMIEPMVSNENLPQWSYIFHDISFIMTGTWIIIIAIAAVIVTRFFPHFPIGARFMIAMGITGAIAVPLESFFISNGYRVYGETTVAHFTGFTLPLWNTPIEVVFAIPCYMALIIAFIRYWETVISNQ
jgi:hypothetical protein